MDDCFPRMSFEKLRIYRREISVILPKYIKGLIQFHHAKRMFVYLSLIYYIYIYISINLVSCLAVAQLMQYSSSDS